MLYLIHSWIVYKEIVVVFSCLLLLNSCLLGISMISPESGEVYPNMTLLFLQFDREWLSQAGIKTAISPANLLLKQLPVAII